ncbi:hypothetical protein I5835_016975 [Clostridioides difficile]
MSGSLNVFNHETNVDLNRRLVCLDLKKLGAGLRTIAMLIMQDLVNSQVSMNFLRGIATWCYFDEFHVLLRDRLTASYCVATGKCCEKVVRSECFNAEREGFSGKPGDREHL